MAARNYYKKSKNQLILCHLHDFIIMNTKIQLFANVLAPASKPLTLILSNSHQTRHYFEKHSTSTTFWQRNSGTNLKYFTNNYFNDFATLV